MRRKVTPSPVAFFLESMAVVNGRPGYFVRPQRSPSHSIDSVQHGQRVERAMSSDEWPQVPAERDIANAHGKADQTNGY